MNLTPRQLEALDAIRDHRRRHGVSPTYQELADHFGISKVTVLGYIEALECHGAIRRRKNKTRSIEILTHTGDDSDLLIRRYRIALADAIRRPMGVVPESAEGLVDEGDLADAETRRGEPGRAAAERVLAD